MEKLYAPPGPPDGVPVIIDLPCGSKGVWNYSAGFGYICDQCFAVVGSIAQPKNCCGVTTA